MRLGGVECPAQDQAESRGRGRIWSQACQIPEPITLTLTLGCQPRKGKGLIGELLLVVDLSELPSRNTAKKSIFKATQACTSLHFQAQSKGDLDLTWCRPGPLQDPVLSQLAAVQVQKSFFQKPSFIGKFSFVTAGLGLWIHAWDLWTKSMKSTQTAANLPEEKGVKKQQIFSEAQPYNFPGNSQAVIQLASQLDTEGKNSSPCSTFCPWSSVFMFTLHRNGPIICLTSINENHTYLEYSVASLFHCSTLQMRKMRPPQS